MNELPTTLQYLYLLELLGTGCLLVALPHSVPSKCDRGHLGILWEDLAL